MQPPDYLHGQESIFNFLLIFHYFDIYKWVKYYEQRVCMSVCLSARISQIENVLNRGSRSDRPRYCVTTPIRAGHRPLTPTLTYNPDFHSQASYVHDLYTQKLKFKVQSVQKKEWKQTDRQTDDTDCFTFSAK